MFSNRYIFIYSTIMVVLVATALAFAAISLKPFQENNIRLEKMQNILAAANIASTPKNAEKLFNQYIKESFIVKANGEKTQEKNAFDIELVNELKKNPNQINLPVFVATMDDNEKLFIVPLRGKGLWGPIWGYISFKSDFNTIYGSMFDHKGETPGLGSEINTKPFQKQFENKQIFDTNDQFTSINVIKGGAGPNNIHGVDAISGGTITSNGVSKMIYDCLTLYEPFFKNQRK